MNTHLVDQRTIWAVLAMEAGLVLPLISLPAQGDRIGGPLGPLLLVLLLPLGYIAVCAFAVLRDPSWRILVGVGAALFSRAIVSVVPEAGVPGVTVWFAHSVVPLTIGIALWWRGAGLSVAEFTASDIRTEFSVLAICMLAALAMVRPFLLPDPLLLGASVGVFAAGGLIAVVLSRQDAAELAPVPLGRLLGVGSALLPAVAAVAVVSVLRPSLLGSMWLLLARVIELAFIPIGWLAAWIASLLPRGVPPGPLQTPPRPTPDLSPDPAALAALEDRVGWIGYVVLFTLLICAALVAILLVRVMLENYLGAPTRRQRSIWRDDVVTDAEGDARGDALAVLAWLRRWLRRRTAPRQQTDTRRPASLDSWSAYQRLLEWSAAHGITRRPVETTRELSVRVDGVAPELHEPVAVVSETYEAERYGDQRASPEQLARIRTAVARLEDG